MMVLATASMAQAQALIRDAEIERTLDRIASPILRAAGLSPNRVKIYIVNSRELNAFVAGGNNIFLYTGLLRRLEDMAELQAVIAHETGHITGGHLARRNDAVRANRSLAGLGLILAAAACSAGGAETAVACTTLVGETSRRNAFAHSRAEEASADQAGLRFMVGAGVDPKATLRVMKLFRGQEVLRVGRADPYVRTHPIWSERIRLLEQKIDAAPRGKPPSQTDAYWHARMVAKFRAFIEPPGRTLKRVRRAKDEYSVLARAIAYHRLPDVKRANQTIDALIASRPKDPFYRELKGQFLLESGNAGAAVKAYQSAVSLAPKEPLIQAGLGRALLALDTRAGAQQALKVLERSATLDPANPGVLRDLARAYAIAGQRGAASLATAERLTLQTRFRDAQIHAKRAAASLPEGSPRWRRAQDILRTTDRILKKRG